VSLVDWLEQDGRELVERYDRLYVPRNDPRWLRRNALVAAGNVGGAVERGTVAAYAEGDDELLREHAEWALARIDGRSGS
jgi:epoxyqueuosine reductase QueG